MNNLKTYFECDGFGGEVSTPTNTLGMGNPDISHDNLSEPIPTSKSQIERDKKKRKRKIKNLSESLFDKDLTKHPPRIGDIYELDRWSVPGGESEYILIDNINDAFPIKLIDEELHKNQWSSFLKHSHKYFYDTLQAPPYSYLECPLLCVLTQIILFCTSTNEIKNKTSQFLDSLIKKSNNKTAICKYEIITLNGAGTQKDDLRMIIFNFDIKNTSEYNSRKRNVCRNLCVCMTLKKRD